MAIETVLELLIAELVSAGRPVPRARPHIQNQVAALEAAIHPLQIPLTLRQFWGRVDPEYFPAQFDLTFSSPERVLWAWQLHRDEMREKTPRVLLPFTNDSHTYGLIELGVTEVLDGPVFEWSYGDIQYTLLYPSLTDLFNFLRLAVNTGAYIGRAARQMPWPNTEGTWSEFEQHRREHVDLSRHPYPGELSFPDEPASWPSRWRRAQDLWVDLN